MEESRDYIDNANELIKYRDLIFATCDYYIEKIKFKKIVLSLMNTFQK